MPDPVVQESPATPVAHPEPETAAISTNITEGEMALRFMDRGRPAPQAPEQLEAPADPGDGSEPEAIEATPEQPAESEDPVTQPEQAEPEAAEAPAEGEEVLSQPNDPEGVKKRIGKALKKRDEAIAAQAAAEAAKVALEAELAELKAKSEQPKQPEQPIAPVVLPTDDPDDRTIQASSRDDLVKLRREAEQALEWAELNAEGIVDDNGETKFTPAQVRQIKVGAQRHLNRYIPQREQWLQAREQGKANARQLFPELFDSKAKEYHELHAVLRARPHLARDPDVEFMYGLVLRGAKALQAEREAATKAATPPPAKPKPPPAPKSEAPPATQARKPSGNEVVKKALAQAEAIYAKTGSAESYQEVLRLRKQSSKS